jgi:hypothetical protein
VPEETAYPIKNLEETEEQLKICGEERKEFQNQV